MPRFRVIADLWRSKATPAISWERMTGNTCAGFRQQPAHLLRVLGRGGGNSEAGSCLEIRSSPSGPGEEFAFVDAAFKEAVYGRKVSELEGSGSLSCDCTCLDYVGQSQNSRRNLFWLRLKFATAQNRSGSIPGMAVLYITVLWTNFDGQLVHGQRFHPLAIDDWLTRQKPF